MHYTWSKPRITATVGAVWVVASVVVLLAPAAVFARSYEYRSIQVELRVNEDATVDVRERQVYDFDGEYTKGWRSIPLRGMDAITDIRVIDGETGRALEYRPKRLVQDAPQRRGTYTTFTKNGEQVIEWYYQARDTERSWTIEYTAHGAIGFHKEHDEVYWNVFTNYDVPVRTASVVVALYQPVPEDKLISTLYTTPFDIEGSRSVRNASVRYRLFDIPPGADVTVAVGFPKDLVDESAYWWWFVGRYYGYLVSGLIVLVTLTSGLVHWIRTEKWNKGRGTIVPHYEPPQDYPPAVAEVLVKEKITKKTWPATIVDLAVRGYIEIEEEETSSLSKTITFFGLTSIGLILVAFVVIFFGVWAVAGLFFVGMLGIMLTNKGLMSVVNRLAPAHYRLKRTDAHRTGDTLYPYEQKLFDTLFDARFADGGIFSTKALQRSFRKRSFSEKIKELKDKLYENVNEKTGAYAKPITKDKYVGMFIMFLLIAVVLVFEFFGVTGAFLLTYTGQMVLMAATLIVCGAGLFIFMRYEARLSKEGFEKREEWLGFKMYLETAEKYRLESLTPETFERYLPYAMIFGVEKKWAKAFESLNISEPDWYHGRAMYVGSAGHHGSFSPGGFSTSFSSSFSSAFASSGGAASGGGGGAGGGSGGGGGGAS